MVENVVAKHHKHPERCERLHRQEDQTSQQHHAPSNHPDNTSKKVVAEIKIKRPGDAQNGEFQKNQPQPTSEKVPSQRPAAAKFAAMQESGCACQKNKSGRYEMRNPAREENAGGWAASGKP